ncbi:MAG: primosomal replication protein N [Candidatus Nitrotoga sp.]
MIQASNQFVVKGEIVAIDELRTTPAGIARVTLKIRHASTQQEVGTARQVQFEISAVAFDTVAQQISRMNIGQRVLAQGFLAQRSLRITQLILHIENITLIKI